MNISDEAVKKIRGLIIFAAIIIACFWKYDVVISVLAFIFHVIFPFVLGGAIAFVLNVPMNFIQRHLFPEDKIKDKKAAKKVARPVSILITLCLVIGVLVLIMFVMIPQLIDTFAKLGESIQQFIPQVQKWAVMLFHDNKDVMDLINHLEFDWNKIMDTGLKFFKNGAGSVLDSTITAARSIVSGLTTFFIAFAFSI